MCIYVHINVILKPLPLIFFLQTFARNMRAYVCCCLCLESCCGEQLKRIQPKFKETLWFKNESVKFFLVFMILYVATFFCYYGY